MSAVDAAVDPTPAGGVRSVSGAGRGALERVRQALSRLGIGRGGNWVGLAVVVVGLIVIGIGWNGASGAGGEVNHVPVVQAQLPWLLSGGFLGLGIVVLGAAMIVSNAQRESEARTAARLEALLAALERTPSVAPAAGSGVSDGYGAEGRMVLAGTASYHVPGCRLARGRREARLITVDEAVDQGLTPCRVCHPPGPEA